MANGEVAGSGTLEEVLANENLGLTVSEDSKDEVEQLEVERQKVAAAAALGGTSSTAVPAAAAVGDFQGVSTKGTKIVDEENKSTGAVELSVYVSYFKATGGVAFFGVFLLAFVASTAVSF
ncbi:hypothetical protein HDU98_005425, partial [Podochytrium sp. JEL0797]